MTAILMAALAWFPVVGDGVPKREVRPVAEVREIAVSDGLTVRITVDASAEQRLVVAGDRNVVARIATNVRRGRLQVFALDPVDPSLPLLVELTLPALERVDAHGASAVEVAGASADRITVLASEASRITLRGQARVVHATVGGASQLIAAELDAEDVTADVRGASSAELRATRSADVAVQYASAVTLRGTPARVVRRLDAGSRLAVE